MCPNCPKCIQIVLNVSQIVIIHMTVNNYYLGHIQDKLDTCSTIWIHLGQFIGHYILCSIFWENKRPRALYSAKIRGHAFLSLAEKLIIYKDNSETWFYIQNIELACKLHVKITCSWKPWNDHTATMVILPVALYFKHRRSDGFSKYQLTQNR